jgi:hypothetical protein
VSKSRQPRAKSARPTDVESPQAPGGPGREVAPRPRLSWTAIVFAFAGNLLFFTLANAVVAFLLSPGMILWASIIGPGLAGALTAIVARQRGGIHALIGGALSLPVIALFIIPGGWRTAIFAACFCTLGGAFTEIILRRTRQAT